MRKNIKKVAVYLTAGSLMLGSVAMPTGAKAAETSSEEAVVETGDEDTEDASETFKHFRGKHHHGWHNYFMNCERPEKPEKPECPAEEAVSEESAGETAVITDSDDNQTTTDDAVKPVKVKKNKSRKKLIKSVVTGKKKLTLSMNNVTYSKDMEISVTDSDGEEVEATVVKKTKKKLMLKIKGISKEEKYTVTVEGVKAKGEDDFEAVSKTFSLK